MRARHLRARPAISASIAHGEEFAGVIHGRAVELDLDAPEHAELRGYYTEVYDETWEAFRQGNPYWRLEPGRMFTYGGIGS